MQITAKRVSIGALIVLLATLAVAPGAVAASSPATTAAWGGGGAMHWSANHVVWLSSNGSRYAVRGHAYMDWDDCWGPTGMRITANFQRLVNGHWMTTQTRTYTQQYSDGGMMMNDVMSYSPTFHARSGDFSHPTRLRFTYRWYEGGTMHAMHMLVRTPS